MRDPQGCIEIKHGIVLRRLKTELAADHFLHTLKARDLVKEGKLIEYKFTDPNLMECKKIEFVTYPHEWCNEQFRDAALLTLAISKDILNDGFELKDCSSWNVLFNGINPIFCDHLSFKKINTSNWWAFSQFIKHFIFPLVIAKKKGINAHIAFASSRDGISPSSAKNILGFERFFTKIWPLMIEPNLSKKSPTLKLHYNSKPYHNNLLNLIYWLLPSTEKNKKTAWIDYTIQRNHYSKELSEKKFKAVQSWLTEIKPSLTIDLGCNTGEFSFLACNLGSEVIAIDSDHESIQKLYQESKSKKLKIYPVLADLDDISGGRGWMGKEFKSLTDRLKNKSDVLMMLAVIHHLAISSSIPYEKIAEFCSNITKKYLILELLSEKDSQVILLASQRRRSVIEFTIERQLLAFNKYFSVIKTVELSTRTLILFSKND